MKVSFLATALGIVIGLAGCTLSSEDTWPAPEEKQISSALQRNAQESIVITVSSSGGGAGDITHRVLVCKSGSKMCELIASVDTNDAPAPALFSTSEGVELIVNRSDYIADFRNFSRELGNLQPGELYLRYRAEGKIRDSN